MPAKPVTIFRKGCVMSMISIDLQSRIPIYEQLYKKIVELVIKLLIYRNSALQINTYHTHYTSFPDNCYRLCRHALNGAFCLSLSAYFFILIFFAVVCISCTIWFTTVSISQMPSNVKGNILNSYICAD